MFARKQLSRVFAFLGMALSGLLLAACKPNAPQSTFGSVGEIAKDQLHLFYIIFWIAAIVFVLVEGALVYIIIKYRRKPTDTHLPPQTHGNTTLEVTWTIIPIILLAFVAVPTYQQISKESAVPRDSKQLRVEVTANQWWWEFRYPELGIVAANEMHIPLETVIDVDLHSRDVIHSFWIPKLAGTLDVVPNRVNKMWFIAPEKGNYYGHCKEFCGIAHAQMRFRVIAEDQATFDAWAAKQKAVPAPPVGVLAEQGAQLFSTKGCVVCHAINGPDADAAQAARAAGFAKGADIFPAPNLTTFGDRLTLGAGLVEKTEANVHTWVKNPDDIKPGNHMKRLAAAYKTPMTDAEVNALVAYLMGRTTDPNATPVKPTPSAPPAIGTPRPTGEVPGGNVSFTVATVGNDLKFAADRLAVKTGSSVTLTLKNAATSTSLEHNWVLVKKGSEDAVAQAGLTSGPTKDWTPPGDPNVLVGTKLVKGGQNGVVTFQAPVAGAYSFICTFPGHTGTMKGVFEVVP